MVLYGIKNLLSIKNILKTLPSSGVINYIKIYKNNVLEKHSEGTRLNGIKYNSTKKVPLVLYLQNPVFGIEIFTNNKK